MAVSVMQIFGLPTVTAVVYLGVILLFVLMALYVGVRFQPLTQDEIERKVEEARANE